MKRIIAALGVSALLAVAPLAAQKPNGGAHPLGSRDNPVRADRPTGQRAYLDRLRCENGAAPVHSRAGSFGPGAFGTIIDGYQVECPGSAPAGTMIFMDMYHSGYREAAAVPGFAIVP